MNDVIPSAVADRYEQCMSVFEERGQTAIAATMEMWNALLEIHARKLWYARFNTAEEWVAYVSELGYTGMSRSSIFSKLTSMRNLMNAGVKQEIAAAAVTAVPGAINMIKSPAEFSMVVRDGDPNQYVQQLTMLTPGEAIKQVRIDKGNTVDMWIHELRRGVALNELVGVVVRSDDKRGYTAYDLKITIEPQIPGNRDLLPAVIPWLIDKVGGHLDKSRYR